MKNSRFKRRILAVGIIFLISLQYRGTISFGYDERSSDRLNNSRMAVKPLNPQSSSPDWNETWRDFYMNEGEGVATDGSGNVYITGIKIITGIVFDAFLLKYDSNGTILWNETWGDSEYSWGYDVATDGSGNVYITGVVSSDGKNIFLVKYNSNGTLLWNETWGDGALGSGIDVDDSGNIYITGHAGSVFDPNVILLKYDSSGNLLWNETWGDLSRNEGNGVVVDGSGNVYITGNTDSHLFLLKYDSSGNLLWNETWGGDYFAGRGNDVTVDDSGNVYITGNSWSLSTGMADVILLKYNSRGNLLWNKSWVGDEGVDNIGKGVVVGGSGNVYITGYTGSHDIRMYDVILLKYDSSGNLLWNETWRDLSYSQGFGIASDGSENIYITGCTSGSLNGASDVILLKYKDEFEEVETIPGYNIYLFPWLIGLSIIYLYLTKKRSINSNLPLN